MSRHNKITTDLNSNDINEIAEALHLICNRTQKKIKSITFQNNAGILNFGSNNRVQIQLPVLSTLKFIPYGESEENEVNKLNQINIDLKREIHELKILLKEKEREKEEGEEEGEEEEKDDEEKEDEEEKEEEEEEEIETEAEKEIDEQENEGVKKKVNNEKRKKRIERLKNLGKSVTSQINVMEDRSNTIISRDQYVENSVNIMISSETQLDLRSKFFHWKRKLSQTNAIENVISVYSYIHLVALLELYEDIIKNKETIQQDKKYCPKRKKNSNGWIFKYMSDQIDRTPRYTKKMYVGASRIKSLYEKGISFDILVVTGCTPSDFLVTEDEYKEFLDQIPNLDNINNDFTPVSKEEFFKKFLYSLVHRFLPENDD
ncbi:unnamed protein product [Rhizophagus irregularis]|nr:unnamed protein product [Rhizophagus irregularis]CAB5363390.1 unnamed protein product [Rhizophagus irregularis]